jgi:protein-L-isoaspartate(D-aspartate) O-methyltransferase
VGPSVAATSCDPYAAARAALVERQLIDRGVKDPAILAAFGAVPRERFVPPDRRGWAYLDEAVPIGEGQTISQPYVVALMLLALRLRPTDRALEVGAGSGYAAALLGRLVASVVAVERLAPLAERAQSTLAELGVANVEVVVGDGSVGWPPGAPYDAVLVSAAGPTVPAELVAQLSPGGRLVMPVGGDPESQHLVRVTPDGTVEDLGGVRFVPLIGEAGWSG